jgi:hypothetical protein
LRKPAVILFVALMATLSMAPVAQADVLTTGKSPASDPNIPVTLMDEPRPFTGEPERSRSGSTQKVSIEPPGTFYGPPSPNCLGRRQIGVRLEGDTDYRVDISACYRDGIVVDAGLGNDHFLTNVPMINGRPVYVIEGYVDGTPSITGIGTPEVVIKVHGLVLNCGGSRCGYGFSPKIEVKIHHTGRVDWSAVK